MESQLNSEKTFLDRSEERHGVLGGIEDFIQSTAYSAMQRPINGVVQLADHLGADWKAPELVIQAKDSDFATTAGTMTGTVLDVVLLSKATTAGLDELNLAGADSVLPTLASRGLSSGLMGLEMTALQPVPEGSNYWAAKEKGLGQNVSSFVIMNGVTSPLQKTLGDGVFSTIFSNTVAGAAGGAANVGIADLVDWKRPTVDQLGTVATWAELGAVMGTVQVATPYVNSAFSRLFKGGSASESSAEGDDADAANTGRGNNKLTDDSKEDADGQDANSVGNKKGGAMNRILRMALRRALMPKQGGFAGAGRSGETAGESGKASESAGSEAESGAVKSQNSGSRRQSGLADVHNGHEHKDKNGLPNLELVHDKP